MVPVTAPEKFTVAVGAPAQSVWLPTGFTFGMGFTVMEVVAGVPGQLPAVGVTVIVEVTGAVPVLVPVKDPILPTPLPAKPVVVLLFVQLYTVPVIPPVQLMAVVGEPLHTDWGATAFTVGVGVTVMVNVTGVPGQPPTVGVTVMVPVVGVVPGLVAVNEAMLPMPVIPSPMAGLLLVQL